MDWGRWGADREAETHIRKDAVMLSSASNAAGTGAPPIVSTTQTRLAALVAEHDDLDAAISALLEAGRRDDLLISRLKKRKLQIKDEIALAAPAAEFCRTA
jgi:hypothetical protein